MFLINTSLATFATGDDAEADGFVAVGGVSN